jgi:polyhydroxybutyrate depolymerase
LIIVIPNGTLGSSDTRGWNDCRADAASNPGNNDVAFINTLLSSIASTYNANTKKVFAVGTSNGGHFAIRLAQEMPDKITAFAAILAANAVQNECTNATLPVSALFMNGTADPIMPYAGGQMLSNRGEVYSTDNTIKYWVSRNHTDTVPESTALPNTNTKDGSTITKQVYKNGKDNTEVALYSVIGGDHTDPSISQRYTSLYLMAVGSQNGDIEMANEVWQFFKTKSK